MTSETVHSTSACRNSVGMTSLAAVKEPITRRRRQSRITEAFGGRRISSRLQAKATPAAKATITPVTTGAIKGLRHRRNKELESSRHATHVDNIGPLYVKPAEEAIQMSEREQERLVEGVALPKEPATEMPPKDISVLKGDLEILLKDNLTTTSKNALESDDYRQTKVLEVVLKPSTEEKELSKEIYTDSATTLNANSIPKIDPPQSLLSTQVSLPAYQRFAHLLSDKTPPLPLPTKYALLERLLYALDNICMLAMGRSQAVIFHRVIKSIESVVGRRVEMLHLEQLKWLGEIDGRFYEFRPISIVWEGRRTESVAIEFIGGQEGGSPTHEQLADRRERLLGLLQRTVNEHHEHFLKGIGFELPAGAILRAWHPSFGLEKVPDIPSLPLLVKRTGNDEHERIPDQIAKVVAEAVKQEALNDQKMPSMGKQSSGSSVLDRIRHREERTTLARMTHDPAVERRIRELKMLSDFAESIAMLFASLGKPTVLLGDAVAKLVQGSKTPTSDREVLEKIERLSSLAPDWLKIATTIAARTLRLNKALSLTAIKGRILAELDTLSKDKPVSGTLHA